jgi:hypothetical protein
MEPRLVAYYKPSEAPEGDSSSRPIWTYTPPTLNAAACQGAAQESSFWQDLVARWHVKFGLYW